MKRALVFLALFISVAVATGCRNSGDRVPVDSSRGHSNLELSTLGASRASSPVSRATIVNDPDLNELLKNTDLAQNHPDEFNWRVLAFMVRAIDRKLQRRTRGGLANDVEFELWPDDGLTFPVTPAKAKPPAWRLETQEREKKSYVFTARYRGRHRHFHFERNPLEERNPPEQRNPPKPRKPAEFASASQACTKDDSFAAAGSGQEVRRNGASFHHIVDGQLYYRQGIAKAVAAAANGQAVTFPTNSIEVKAVWLQVPLPAPGSNPPTSYHWNKDNCGNMYQLLAIHVMTRALTNWTWATWELSQNLNRCKTFGCSDSFGYITPGPINCTNSPCPDLPESPELKQLGIAGDWKNYRLDGSQTCFGKPPTLGNSIIESKLQNQNPSCIACHYLARSNIVGMPAYGPYARANPPNPIPVDPRQTMTDGQEISFLWSVVRHTNPACDLPLSPPGNCPKQ